jgi:hypothetical protein
MLLNTGTGKTQSKHGASCSCPACLGLQCLERPRYISGQLLTETDLNSEQEYMLAKQRLHNRYLHGTGIVCGLQVTCSTTAGAVTIESGYAIDPCGNDIIVCNTHDFPVIQRIQDCEKARKRQRKGNCDPLVSPPDKNCKDLEHHYCLTIAYTEQESRLTPTLRQGSATNTSNGCGCNGSGKKNGCGCNSSSSSSGTQYKNSIAQTTNYTGMSPSSASSQSSSAMSCQPTRVLEGYQIDISEVPPDYCGNMKDALEDTLLAKIIDCFTSLKGFFDRKLPRNVYNVLTPLAFTGNIDTTVSLDELYRSCCYLRQTIHDLYGCDPLSTHCQTLDVLSQVCCQSPPSGEATEEVRALYVEQTRTTLYDLLALLMQYILDCVCQALMPPCPPAQTDDRLTLACLTIKNDQIIDICNFCHRRYAGSFPALYYWLSLVPVIPLIAYAVERLCCYDWLSLDRSSEQGKRQGSMFRGNLVNGLTSLLSNLDPAGSWLKEIYADNFAMPRNYADKIGQMLNKMSSPAKIAETLNPRAFNLTKIMDKSVAEATTALQRAGVTPVIHPVASADEVPILRHLATSPFVMAGDHVLLFNANDTVVGYAAHTPAPEIDQVKNDVASLKDTVAQLPQAAGIDQLKSDVETLKSNIVNVAQSSELDAVKSDVETLMSGLAGAAQLSSIDPIKNDIEMLKSGLANAAQTSTLDPMKFDIETLRSGITNAAQVTDVSQLRNVIDALQYDLANAAQSSALDPIKSDVETLKSSIANAAQSSALDPIKGDVETLKSSIANTAQATDFNQLRDEVDGLKRDSANAAQSSALDGIKNDVEVLKGELANAAQSSALDPIKSDVETLKENIASSVQAAEVNQIRSDIEALKNDFANVPQAAEVGQLRGDVETLRNDLAQAAQADVMNQIKSDVEALQSAMANVVQVAEVNSIRDEVSGLKNDVETLRNNLASVAQPPAPPQEISDLQATISALQDQLVALRSDVAQLKSSRTRSTGKTGGTPPAAPPDSSTPGS